MGINIQGGNAEAGDGGDARGGDVNAELHDVSQTIGSEVKNDNSRSIPKWVGVVILILVAGLIAAVGLKDQVLELIGQ